MKKSEAAESINERTPRIENVFLHPRAFIKMMDREDMPQPTKLPHWRMELAVARLSSGKYSESSEKDIGLKAAAIIPRSTRLIARKPKESSVLTSPIVTPDPAIAAARTILRFTKGVAFPKNKPVSAKGKVYATPVKIPKFFESSG